MSTTIIQRALCCASLAMTSSVTTHAATWARRSVSQAGVARTARSQSAMKDVFMERASDQVSANATPATKERSATNVYHIQDAKTVSARSPGSVDATKTGVEYSVTKVSNKS